MRNNAVLGSTLYPSIHDPFDGSLLAGGQIFFYEEDQVTPQSVYTDPFRTNTYPNPLILQSVGQQPPIYYEPDVEYWIEIYRAPAPGCDCLDEMPLYSFSYYADSPPSETSDFADNFISNGQFSYPLNFNRADDLPGIITDGHTFVAQGWEFEITTSTINQIFVSFVPLFTSPTANANPQNFFNIQVNSFGLDSNKLDLFQTIGYVNALQGRTVTFSVDGISTIGASQQIQIIIEQIYDGADIIETPVGTIELNATESKQVLTFDFPPVIANPVDLINNRANLRLRFPLETLINISITNIQLELGTIANPRFIEPPRDQNASRAFFNHYVTPNDATEIEGESEYNKLTYINNQFSWSADTGIFSIIPVDSVPDDMVICAGQTYNISEYSAAGIPYQRLYDKIGNTFGGNADSVVATSTDETVSVSPPNGGKENSAFSTGTVGTILTITKVEEGYKLETTVQVLEFSTTNVFRVTFQNLTPLPMNPVSPGFNVEDAPYGYWNLRSGSSPILLRDSPNEYTTSYDFLSSNANDYVTKTDPNFNNPAGTAENMFDFSSLNPVDTTRADYNFSPVPLPSYNVIRIKVDGSFGPGDVDRLVGVVTVDVDFSSSLPLSTNVNNFAKAVNNGFQYDITINSSLTGSAGAYFEYSSTATDYYGWFTVDGNGTDPAVPGRTGVQIALSSIDDLDDQARKIAQAISLTTFSLPTQGDFPAIPNLNLVYAVHL